MKLGLQARLSVTPASMSSPLGPAIWKPELPTPGPPPQRGPRTWAQGPQAVAFISLSLFLSAKPVDSQEAAHFPQAEGRGQGTRRLGAWVICELGPVFMTTASMDLIRGFLKPP